MNKKSQKMSLIRSVCLIFFCRTSKLFDLLINSQDERPDHMPRANRSQPFDAVHQLPVITCARRTASKTNTSKRRMWAPRPGGPAAGRERRRISSITPLVGSLLRDSRSVCLRGPLPSAEGPGDGDVPASLRPAARAPAADQPRRPFAKVGMMDDPAASCAIWRTKTLTRTHARPVIWCFIFVKTAVKLKGKYTLRFIIDTVIIVIIHEVQIKLRMCTTTHSPDEKWEDRNHVIYGAEGN